MRSEIRKNYYEILNTKFYDSTSSGVGDYKGISSKVSYFSELGIDEIIIPSILDNYEEIKDPKFIKIHYGDILDLKEMISIFKSRDIKVNMVFDFKKSDKYFENFSNYKTIYSSKNKEDLQEISKTSEFIMKKDVTKVIDLEWLRTEKKEKFKEIINFYNQLGIDGIVFKNILYINKPEINYNENSHIIINDLIENIKLINNKIKIFASLDFSFYKHNLETNILSNFKFDELFLDYYSEYWLHKKYPNDYLTKYNWLKNILFFIKILKTNIKTSFVMNNEFYGRIASRLCACKDKEEMLAFKKMIFSVFILNNHNNYFFQGDEIGQENIIFKSEDELNEKDFSYRKRFLEYKGVTPESYFNVRSKLSAKNNNTSFAWFGNKGLGFNKNEINYFKKPENYKSNNLYDNFTNEESLWNWIIKLLKFKKLFFSDFDSSKNLKISLNFPSISILKYKINFIRTEILILINLTNKNKWSILNLEKYKLKYSSSNLKVNNKNNIKLSKYQVLIFEREKY
ncbi:alpha-amylase family glycosyl hydrolase [Mycoplasma sp. 1012]